MAKDHEDTSMSMTHAMDLGYKIIPPEMQLAMSFGLGNEFQKFAHKTEQFYDPAQCNVIIAMHAPKTILTKQNEFNETM